MTLYAVNLGVEIGGGSADATALALAGALTPLLGVLVLSATLGGVVLILSVCITSVYEAVRGAGLTHPLRLARWQWKRLSLLLFALAASYALTSN